MYDLIVKSGIVVDGTGAARRQADLAIKDGRIEGIGDFDTHQARQVIDARGLIVAPGVIDLHTHYDAQLFWDPYCRSSGWHGTTTTIIGNCGFGFAPCKPSPTMHERYMRMMENTEQLAYSAVKSALRWDWETFPQWLDALRRTPKGLNFATYLPLNPLLSYVIGPDEAKRRPATQQERAQMRAILHEAMDAGACGFSFSHLGPNENGHVDFDFTAMPADVMDEEEALNLARVLKERGEGVIQVLTEFQGVNPEVLARGRVLVEKLAAASGRPIMHGVVSPAPGSPDLHRAALKWLDEAVARGGDIYTQAFVFRAWSQFRVIEFNAWDGMPIWREFSRATPAEKLEKANSEEYRARLRSDYDPKAMLGSGARLEDYVLADAQGNDIFAIFEGQRLEVIANELGRPLTDTFMDVIAATDLRAEFMINVTSDDDSHFEELLRHPRVIAGISDGGAHNKFFTGGYWSTDLISWLARDRKRFTLEEIHSLLSGRPARVFGLADRGTIRVGAAADLLIYDLDSIGYTFGKYDKATDLPGGEWAHIVKPKGIEFILANGEITHRDGIATGSYPGQLLVNERRRAVRAQTAAE